MRYGWNDEIPWTPEEMDEYRHGGVGITYKRTWGGTSREELLRFYGPYLGKGMSVCPDCGRPSYTRDMEMFQLGRCWGCYMENKEPGFHSAHQLALEARKAEPQPSLKRLKG